MIMFKFTMSNSLTVSIIQHCSLAEDIPINRPCLKKINKTIGNGLIMCSSRIFLEPMYPCVTRPTSNMNLERRLTQLQTWK